MKRLYIAGLALGLSLAIAPAAHAAETLPAPTPEPKAVPSAQQPGKLNILKTRGASEIDRRTGALQTALGKLQTSSQLAAADKQALEAQIKLEIDNLAAIKNRLVADTRLSQGRTDVHAVFQSYGPYALLLPKARLVATADRYIATGKKLTTIADELQAKTDELNGQGKDTTAIQASLDDMKAKLASAAKTYDGMTAKALALTPADYAASHKVLVQYRDGLRTARSELKSAREIAGTIVDELKALSKK